MMGPSYSNEQGKKTAKVVPPKVTKAGAGKQQRAESAPAAKEVGDEEAAVEKTPEEGASDEQPGSEKEKGTTPSTASEEPAAKELEAEEGEEDDNKDLEPPEGCAPSNLIPLPRRFKFDAPLYGFLNLYKCEYWTTIDLYDCILGTDLGLGGHALNETNSAKLAISLLKSNWAPQTAIIVVAALESGKAFVVDGNHRVHALMNMTDEQRLQVLGGTTKLKCVAYQGVPANLLAILALHVNEEGLTGSGVTTWHKVRFALKAVLHMSADEQLEVTEGALEKAVNWTTAGKSASNLTPGDILLVTKLAKRFHRSGVTLVLEQMTVFETNYPMDVRSKIREVTGDFAVPTLHWGLQESSRNKIIVPEEQAAAQRSDQDDSCHQATRSGEDT